MRLTRKGEIRMASNYYEMKVKKEDLFTTVAYDFMQGAYWAESNRKKCSCKKKRRTKK